MVGDFHARTGVNQDCRIVNTVEAGGINFEDQLAEERRQPPQ